MVVPLLVFLSLQRFFVRGMTAGVGQGLTPEDPVDVLASGPERAPRARRGPPRRRRPPGAAAARSGAGSPRASRRAAGGRSGGGAAGRCRAGRAGRRPPRAGRPALRPGWRRAARAAVRPAARPHDHPGADAAGGGDLLRGALPAVGPPGERGGPDVGRAGARPLLPPAGPVRGRHRPGRGRGGGSGRWRSGWTAAPTRRGSSSTWPGRAGRTGGAGRAVQLNIC